MSSQTIDANKIEVGMTKEEVEKAVGECHNYAIMMGDGSMSYENAEVEIKGDTVFAVKTK